VRGRVRKKSDRGRRPPIQGSEASPVRQLLRCDPARLDKKGKRISVPTTTTLGVYPTLKVKDKARKFLVDPYRATAQADSGSFREVAENSSSATSTRTRTARCRCGPRPISSVSSRSTSTRIGSTVVCAENLIRVDDVTESPKLVE
jgi:hypothetical protein